MNIKIKGYTTEPISFREIILEKNNEKLKITWGEQIEEYKRTFPLKYEFNLKNIFVNDKLFLEPVNILEEDGHFNVKSIIFNAEGLNGTLKLSIKSWEIEDYKENQVEKFFYKDEFEEVYVREKDEYFALEVIDEFWECAHNFNEAFKEILLRNEGDVVAAAQYTIRGGKVEEKLEVAGKIKLVHRNIVFSKPEQYPESVLKTLLRKGNEPIIVVESNYLTMRTFINDEEVDKEDFYSNISYLSEEELKEQMKENAKNKYIQFEL